VRHRARDLAVKLPTTTVESLRDARKATRIFSITKRSAAVETFVTRKITRAVRTLWLDCRINSIWAIWMPNGLGLCQEYVEAMWLMLQQDQPV